MGRENFETFYPCGCIRHYSYEECCGGSIYGTEKEYMEWCDQHKVQVDELTLTIMNAQRKLDEIQRNICFPPEPKRPKLLEEKELVFDRESYEKKAREWCTRILSPALDAARSSGLSFLEIQDETHTFDPQCCTDILETRGLTHANVSYNANTGVMKFSF